MSAWSAVLPGRRPQATPRPMPATLEITSAEVMSRSVAPSRPGSRSRTGSL